MSGKLKIIRVLANPTRKRKAPKKKAMRRNARPRARAARSLSGAWVVRIITPARAAAWWTGAAWSKKSAAAKRYGSQNLAHAAFKKSGVKRSSWIVADIMPA